jgi:hypothetical protein
MQQRAERNPVISQIIFPKTFESLSGEEQEQILEKSTEFLYRLLSNSESDFNFNDSVGENLSKLSKQFFEIYPLVEEYLNSLEGRYDLNSYTAYFTQMIRILAAQIFNDQTEFEKWKEWDIEEKKKDQRAKFGREIIEQIGLSDLFDGREQEVTGMISILMQVINGRYSDKKATLALLIASIDLPDALKIHIISAVTANINTVLAIAQDKYPMLGFEKGDIGSLASIEESDLYAIKREFVLWCQQVQEIMIKSQTPPMLGRPDYRIENGQFVVRYEGSGVSNDLSVFLFPREFLANVFDLDLNVFTEMGGEELKEYYDFHRGKKTKAVNPLVFSEIDSERELAIDALVEVFDQGYLEAHKLGKIVELLCNTKPPMPPTSMEKLKVIGEFRKFLKNLFPISYKGDPRLENVRNFLQNKQFASHVKIRFLIYLFASQQFAVGNKNSLVAENRRYIFDSLAKKVEGEVDLKKRKISQKTIETIGNVRRVVPEKEFIKKIQDVLLEYVGSLEPNATVIISPFIKIKGRFGKEGISAGTFGKDALAYAIRDFSQHFGSSDHIKEFFEIDNANERARFIIRKFVQEYVYVDILKLF